VVSCLGLRISIPFKFSPYSLNFSYDTGTIGGVIAMQDWLETFGKYDPTLNWYIPTNDKSLVVCFHAIWINTSVLTKVC